MSGYTLVKMPNESQNTMSLTQRKIEEIAVTTVESSFNCVNWISPLIMKNDRGVCTDGHLEVYSSSAMKKSDLRGKIPVQVKGTTKKVKSKNGAIKKPVSVVDLRKYYETDGGIMYFVVSIANGGTSNHVFYKELLPYDLKLIIDKVEPDQESVTLSFSSFPSDAKSIGRICSEFLRNKEMQATVRRIDCITTEDLEAKGIPIEEWSINKTFYAGELPFSPDSFKNGAYVYAKTPWGESYVIDKIDSPTSISVGTNRTVSSGTVSYETLVSLENSEDGGTSIRFEGFNMDFRGKGSLHYCDTGTLRERLQRAELMAEVLRTGSLLLDGNELFRGITLDDGSPSEIEERRTFYERNVRLMDQLRLKKDWNIDDLDDEGLWKLGLLYKGLVDKEPVRLSQKVDSLSYVDIDGIRVKLLVYERKKDDCRLVDVLDPEWGHFLHPSNPSSEESDLVAIPALFIFSAEDFRLVGNIDAARFREELSEYHLHPGLGDASCNKLLDMLNAWDEGAVCADDLLECCEALADALVNLDGSSELYLVNKLQVLARKRNLTKEEEHRLNDLVIKHGSDTVQASAYILLGHHELAKHVINSLAPEERDRFLSWPIAHLLKEV